ncbi:MAG: hypothetical protein WCG06_00515 [Candidatus Omnitrophota bacterium]
MNTHSRYFSDSQERELTGPIACGSCRRTILIGARRVIPPVEHFLQAARLCADRDPVRRTSCGVFSQKVVKFFLSEP